MRKQHFVFVLERRRCCQSAEHQVAHRDVDVSRAALDGRLVFFAQQSKAIKPPKSTVFEYYRAWQRDGTWQTIHNVLRGKVRQQEGRKLLTWAENHAASTSIHMLGISQSPICA